MATSKLTPDADAVVCEIDIAAPPERVFQALLDREQALQWGSSDAFVMTSWNMDARLGGKWSFVAKERTPSGQFSVDEFKHHGEILEFDPPRVLAYTWFANHHENPAHKTIVRWDLTPTAAGTHVKVTHSGLAAMPETRKGYSEGWPGLLLRIKKFMEKPSTSAPTGSAASDEITAEIHIAASPERVFQALTDPAQVPQWWGQAGIYECKQFQSDLRVGGKWRCSGVSGDGKQFDIHGVYTEIIPSRLLASTWLATWTGDIQTQIRWELEPASHGTRVRIRHTGFAAHPELAQAYRGWPRMLGWLQSFLDRGETVSARPLAYRN